MLLTKEKGILLNIIQHSIRVEDTMIGITRNDFDINKDIQDIICFNILQIGELAKRLSPEFINEHCEIPWKNIKGMRDVVAHGYGTIKLEVVWTVATSEVGVLHQYCQKILDEE